MKEIFDNLESPINKFYYWEKEIPNNVFLRQPYGDKWHTVTYKEAGEQARKIRNALYNLGLKKGDHIGILSKNCYHWILADLAIAMGGFVSVPYYASLPKKQLAEVIEKSDVKAIFLGKLEQWGNREEAIPESLKVVKFPHYKGNANITIGEDWDALIADNSTEGEDFVPALDDLWTILFTSGTTGSPKGVMHTYKNPAIVLKIEELTGFLGTLKLEEPKYFSFLPLNHVAERIAVEMNCFAAGGVISFAESIDTFAKNLQDTQPTFIFAVPRIWTKFYQGVLGKVSQKKMDMLLKIPIINNIFKKKIRTALGLRDTKIALTGAAITPLHIKKWYKKLGIHLIEVYGMTEVCGSTVAGADLNAPLDSVGSKVPYCEIKIDPDTKEVLMKTPFVMKGYYKEEEKTKEVLKDGWMYSGDRGELDDKGYLRIVGRVKDAFKTAKGIYITPNPMEEVLMKNEFVEQVCVAGLGIPQPIALVNLSEQGDEHDKEELKKSLIASLEEVNLEKASQSKISTIVVTKEKWTEENNFLTPTLKVKRNEIDNFYSAKYLECHDDDEQVII